MAECNRMEKKQFSRRESNMGEGKERSVNIKRSKLTVYVCVRACMFAFVYTMEPESDTDGRLHSY